MAVSRAAATLVATRTRGGGSTGIGSPPPSSSSITPPPAHNQSQQQASPSLSSILRGIFFSTCAVATGDYICQRLENPDEWDQARTQRMATATAFVMSPCHWFIVIQLERYIPGTTTQAILKKTLANGIMAIPMISLNFATITALEGRDVEAWQGRVQHKLLPTVTAGICFWPMVNFFNFRYVLLENRPLVGALAGVGWNVYLSSVVNSSNIKKKMGEEGLVASSSGVAGRTISIIASPPVSSATVVNQQQKQQGEGGGEKEAVVATATAPVTEAMIRLRTSITTKQAL